MERKVRCTDKLIVFDIGNVLLRFDVNRAVRNFDRREPGTGKSLAEHLWRSPLSYRFETGRIRGEDLYRKVRLDLGLRTSYRRFCLSFNDIFTPVKRNLALFKELAAHRQLALLSNTNDIHWKHLFQKYPVLKKARWPYSSHLLGHMKPDARAFKKLSQITGYPFDRMLFVDDRPENIAAAKRLGITALLYTGQNLRRHSLFKTLLTAGKNGGRT